MAQQVIKIGTNGSRSMRVLEAVTPVNNTVAPAVNATHLGQVYVDTEAKAIYLAIAVGSEVKANDWLKLVPESKIIPLTGAVAPDAHAAFIGQIYVDTVKSEVYVAIATDSEAAANDWQKVTPTPAG